MLVLLSMWQQTERINIHPISLFMITVFCSTSSDIIAYIHCSEIVSVYRISHTSYHRLFNLKMVAWNHYIYNVCLRGGLYFVSFSDACCVSFWLPYYIKTVVHFEMSSIVAWVLWASTVLVHANTCALVTELMSILCKFCYDFHHHVITIQTINELFFSWLFNSLYLYFAVIILSFPFLFFIFITLLI